MSTQEVARFDRALMHMFCVDYSEHEVQRPVLGEGESALPLCVEMQFYDVMACGIGARGEKTTDYRADKPGKRPYWHPRLEGRKYDYVVVYGGVNVPDPRAPWTMFKWERTRTMHLPTGSFVCGPYSNGSTKAFDVKKMWAVELGCAVQKHDPQHSLTRNLYAQTAGEDLSLGTLYKSKPKPTHATPVPSTADPILVDQSTSDSDGGGSQSDIVDVRNSLTRLASMMATNESVSSSALQTRDAVTQELAVLRATANALEARLSGLCGSSPPAWATQNLAQTRTDLQAACDPLNRAMETLLRRTTGGRAREALPHEQHEPAVQEAKEAPQPQQSAPYERSQAPVPATNVNATPPEPVLADSRAPAAANANVYAEIYRRKRQREETANMYNDMQERADLEARRQYTALERQRNADRLRAQHEREDLMATFRMYMY